MAFVIPDKYNNLLNIKLGVDSVTQVLREELVTIILLASGRKISATPLNKLIQIEPIENKVIHITPLGDTNIQATSLGSKNNIY